ALQRVEPLDGGSRLGIRREAVDRVRREQDDAAGGYAALEPCGVLVRHGTPPTVTRSSPARSRMVRASPSSDRTAAAWCGACSRATRLPCGAPARSARIASRPSAPAKI